MPTWAVSFEVCADPRLVPALNALGYDRHSGNRFIRTQGTRPLVIDVLAPSYLGRLMSNQPHGDLVVDEIPGLLAPCDCRPFSSRSARS
jgi:hypothetical protein